MTDPLIVAALGLGQALGTGTAFAFVQWLKANAEVLGARKGKLPGELPPLESFEVRKLLHVLAVAAAVWAVAQALHIGVPDAGALVEPYTEVLVLLVNQSVLSFERWRAAKRGAAPAPADRGG